VRARSLLGGLEPLARKHPRERFDVSHRIVRSPEDLAERVRKGLPFAALLAVMEQYGISRDVLCTILHLSARSFLRRKKQRRLSPDESDRLYRLARVIAHANRVFEDPGESAEWIQSPNAALGKQLRSSIGARRGRAARFL